MTRRARRRDDHGMTLSELIISITILSFIMGAITFSLVVALKNTEQNKDRVTGGSSAQTLSAWFPSDVQSMRADSGDTDPGAETPCGPDPGTNVVLLHRGAASEANVVSYRLVPDGTEYQLRRVSCIGGARSENIVVIGITDPATVVLGVTDTSAVVVDPPVLDSSVSVGVLRLDAVVGGREPVAVSVSGTPRNPGLPIPCALTSGSPQTLVVTSGGSLLADATFQLATTGSCGALGIAIPTGGSPASLSPALDQYGSASYATVTTSAATWSPGNRAVTVTNDGTTLTTFPLAVVAEPCSVSSSSPATVLFGPDYRLSSNTPLSVSTRGPCSSMSADTPTGGSPATLTKSLSGGSGTWNTTLTPAEATWSEGTKVVTVKSGSTNVGSVALDVAKQPCSFVSASPAIGGTDSGQQLIGNVTMTVQTRGWCGALTLAFDTGGAPDPYVSAPLTGGPFTWTGVVPRAGVTWSEGLHDVTVRNDGNDLGYFTFRTRRVCSMIANNPSRVVLSSSNRLALPTTFSVWTVGDCTDVDLSISTAGSPATISLDLDPAGFGLYTGEVDPSDATWSTGTRTVTVTGVSGIAGTQTLGTYPVTVLKPACIVTWADDDIDVRASDNTVRNGQRISFHTSGPCGPTMTVRVIPPGGTLQLVAATQTSPGEWETGDLGGTTWNEDQAAQVTVFNTPSAPYDDATVAGSFLVLST